MICQRNYLPVTVSNYLVLDEDLECACSVYSFYINHRGFSDKSCKISHPGLEALSKIDTTFVLMSLLYYPRAHTRQLQNRPLHVQVL